jgi:hypothetical protein
MRREGSEPMIPVRLKNCIMIFIKEVRKEKPVAVWS